MKSIIFPLGICTFFCMAFASPAKVQMLDQLESLLDKITDEQSMDYNDPAESFDQAAMESLMEKARTASLWKKLLKTAVDHYTGKPGDNGPE